MTENNPGIADLSDLNRPINLGEVFSEIYDNEYTEVLMKLKETEGEEKTKEIHIKILNTAESCLNFCKNREEKQFEKIMEVLGLSNQGKVRKDDLPKGVLKHIKELRTSLLEKEQQLLEEDYQKEKKEPCVLEFKDENVKRFICSCLSLFWRACIQTPPLYFNFEVKPGSAFDNAVHRKFTVNGPTVDYTVWPTVYLHENGPVLVRGIVQCKRDKGQEKKENRGNDPSGKPGTHPGKAVQVKEEDNNPQSPRERTENKQIREGDKNTQSPQESTGNKQMKEGDDKSKSSQGMASPNPAKTGAKNTQNIKVSDVKSRSREQQ
ncbi:uncharacterized protein LOC134274869 [Saccostrea cucullata]|uniref:uncharacterized protein LOC134274869 n=1 Tax=Saccostrea cuccullata TaxID=36930 RepID=UPI002ED10C12